jgi:hypothetical protein
MFILVVGTPNVHQYPTIGLESGNDVAARHHSTIHTIHTLSIPKLRPNLRGILAAGRRRNGLRRDAGSYGLCAKISRARWRARLYWA